MSTASVDNPSRNRARWRCLHSVRVDCWMFGRGKDSDRKRGLTRKLLRGQTWVGFSV